MNFLTARTAPSDTLLPLPRTAVTLFSRAVFLSVTDSSSGSGAGQPAQNDKKAIKLVPGFHPRYAIQGLLPATLLATRHCIPGLPTASPLTTGLALLSGIVNAFMKPISVKKESTEALTLQDLLKAARADYFLFTLTETLIFATDLNSLYTPDTELLKTLNSVTQLIYTLMIVANSFFITSILVATSIYLFKSTNPIKTFSLLLLVVTHAMLNISQIERSLWSPEA